MTALKPIKEVHKAYAAKKGVDAEVGRGIVTTLATNVIVAPARATAVANAGESVRPLYAARREHAVRPRQANSQVVYACDVAKRKKGKAAVQTRRREGAGFLVPIEVVHSLSAQGSRHFGFLKGDRTRAAFDFCALRETHGSTRIRGLRLSKQG